MRARWIAFCLWLAGLAGYAPYGDFDPALIDRARDLCAQQTDLMPDSSGEAKRHQVYAQLIKEYPTVAKRRLALAIELGLGY